MSCPAPVFSDALCPLCHQSNQCAVSLGKAAEKCWCMDACIPRKVLAAVPLAERGQRCVCAACASAGAGITATACQTPARDVQNCKGPAQ